MPATLVASDLFGLEWLVNKGADLPLREQR